MITLLPRKAFEIKLADDSIIKGQYSLWTIKRYCDRKKLSLSQLSEQLSAENLSFDDICQLILSAVEYTSRKEKMPFPYNDIDACEWIDQLGGLGSDNFTALMNHAKSDEETPEGEGEEKKSL